MAITDYEQTLDLVIEHCHQHGIQSAPIWRRICDDLNLNNDDERERFFWQIRDQARLHLGLWQPIPDSEDWIHHIDKRFALHVSEKDPTMVAYTPWQDRVEKAQRDVTITTRLGKFLTKYYAGNVFTGPTINNISNRFQNRNLTPATTAAEGEKPVSRYRMDMLEGPEAIGDFYEQCSQTGLHSCMTKPWNTWELRDAKDPQKKYVPASFWGFNEHIRLAVLRDTKSELKPIARSIVNITKKIYTRIYGNQDIMQAEFALMGYRSGDLKGLEFPAVRVTGSRIQGIGILYPYIDCASKGKMQNGKIILAPGGMQGNYAVGALESQECSDCGASTVGERAYSVYGDPTTMQTTRPVCSTCYEQYVNAIVIMPRNGYRAANIRRDACIELTQHAPIPGTDKVWGGHTIHFYRETFEQAKAMMEQEYGTNTLYMPNSLVSAYLTDAVDAPIVKVLRSNTVRYYRPGTGAREIYKPYVDAHPERFWVYKGAVHNADDKVKAIISRDRKMGLRPKSLTYKHANKEEYYDYYFARKFMYFHIVRANAEDIGVRSTIRNIRPRAAEGRWCTAIEREGARFAHHWPDEEATQAA